MTEEQLPGSAQEQLPGSAAYDRESEVAALLDADETVMGDVWRRLRRGSTPAQVAAEDGITQGPIYSFINLHNALLHGTVSPSPSVARASPVASANGSRPSRSATTSVKRLSNKSSCSTRL